MKVYRLIAGTGIKSRHGLFEDAVAEIDLYAGKIKKP
jgi:hypothetical protein